MRAGDLVRFRATHWLGGSGMPEEERPYLLGLLVSYHAWEKIATILYNGEVLRIQARNVQKFGKKGL